MKRPGASSWRVYSTFVDPGSEAVCTTLDLEPKNLNCC